MTVDPRRRQALLDAKLGALVRHWAGEAPVVFGAFGRGAFGRGAALLRDGQAWVLADEQPGRLLGPALAWARQQGAAGLNLVADHEAGHLARRAEAFRSSPRVWAVDGRTLQAATPEPLAPPAAPDPRLLAMVPLIEAGGAMAVVEHGVVTGEVAGLEVCRATFDPHLDTTRLEVGVGAHDREAFQLIHGDVPPVEALADVVTKVAPYRQPGAPPHPLNRWAAERLLRHRLVADPALVGAHHLAPAAPPVPRLNVKDAVPCVARGVDEAGQPMVVVCSVGIDLDVVPFASDARLAAGPTHQLVIVVPARDLHPVTLALVDDLREPAVALGVALV